MTRLRHGGAVLAFGVVAALAVPPGLALATPRGQQNGGPEARPRSTGRNGTAGGQHSGAGTKQSADRREYDRPGHDRAEIRSEGPWKSETVTPPTGVATPSTTPPNALNKVHSSAPKLTAPRSTPLVTAPPSAPEPTVSAAPVPAPPAHAARASATPAVAVRASRRTVPVVPGVSPAPRMVTSRAGRGRVLPTTRVLSPAALAPPTPSQTPLVAIAPASATSNHPSVGARAGVLRASTGFLGVPMSAAARLSIPLGLLLIVAVFLIVQAGLNRRDPKWADAPATPDDDALSFS